MDPTDIFGIALDGDDHITCPTCRGYGKWTAFEMCSRCAGSGYIPLDEFTPEEMHELEVAAWEGTLMDGLDDEEELDDQHHG